MTNYHEIYGVTLEEYCKAHDVCIDNLIKKVKTDIRLLKTRLQEVVDKDEYVINPLINEIFQILKKKEKHLKRLKGWKCDGKESI